MPQGTSLRSLQSLQAGSSIPSALGGYVPDFSAHGASEASDDSLSFQAHLQHESLPVSPTSRGVFAHLHHSARPGGLTSVVITAGAAAGAADRATTRSAMRQISARAPPGFFDLPSLPHTATTAAATAGASNGKDALACRSYDDHRNVPSNAADSSNTNPAEFMLSHASLEAALEADALCIDGSAAAAAAAAAPAHAPACPIDFPRPAMTATSSSSTGTGAGAGVGHDEGAGASEADDVFVITPRSPIVTATSAAAAHNTGASDYARFGQYEQYGRGPGHHGNSRTNSGDPPSDDSLALPFDHHVHGHMHVHGHGAGMMSSFPDDSDDHVESQSRPQSHSRSQVRLATSVGTDPDLDQQQFVATANAEAANRAIAADASKAPTPASDSAGAAGAAAGEAAGGETAAPNLAPAAPAFAAVAPARVVFAAPNGHAPDAAILKHTCRAHAHCAPGHRHESVRGSEMAALASLDAAAATVAATAAVEDAAAA